MFDHVTIRVSDREASERFYETVLRAICIDKTATNEWIAEWNDFTLSPAVPDKPVTRGLHIGFGAPSRELPIYHEGYYGAFVLDPDGNNIEVVNHNRG